jgi:LmbE family N-acetylglucosaminyl deacetylase
MAKDTIVVFSAHSDDFVIGAGGTIAKYTEEGKKVTAIIFTYGEKSHAWLKEKIVQKMRIEETFEAGKVINCKAHFFNLKEGKFMEGYKKIESKLLTLIEKEKPSKLFTHSGEDPHPDHKSVHKITLDIYDKLKKKPEVYTYSVWNPVSFKTEYPSMYIDISKTFSKKLEALKTFKSQKIHVAYPFVLLVYRAIKSGIKIRKRWGEHFFRIK